MITEMPRVMISAFTRKIPTPIPLTTPIASPTPSAIRIALAEPSVPKRETKNALAVAVVATERSTPAVSITSVCPADSRPSTAA